MTLPYYVNILVGVGKVGVAFLNDRSLVTLHCHSNTCVGRFGLPLSDKQLIKRGNSLLPRFIFVDLFLNGVVP